jgi:hypothetical protein
MNSVPHHQQYSAPEVRQKLAQPVRAGMQSQKAKAPEARQIFVKRKVADRVDVVALFT